MRPVPFLLLVLVAAAGCLDVGDRAPTTPTPAPPFAFGAPVVPQQAPNGFGSEPGILAAKDGSLYIVSVLGSATERGDALWKSQDGGATWTSLGKPDYPFGGGDADLDEDAAGTLYLPGQWRPAAVPPNPVGSPYVTGGESMAVSPDGGRTWRTNPVASVLPVTDRQWTATYRTGNAWLAFNQAQRGLVVTHSADSGLTWTSLVAVPGTADAGDGVAVAGGPNGIPGDILADPRDGTLYLPYGPGIGGGSREHRLFVSRDGGSTFEPRVIHRAPEGEQAGAIFGTLAQDDEGGLYYAWAESAGAGARGVRVLLSTSPDRGASWTPPRPVSPANMTAVFPWVVAGAPGRVAVAFYAAAGEFLSDEAPEGAEWHPYVAFSADARAANATFEPVRLSGSPNHKGPLCTGGTGCDPQYRRLGDFFEIGLTPAGRVVAVWVDDTAPTRLNVFAAQTSGSLR